MSCSQNPVCFTGHVWNMQSAGLFRTQTTSKELSKVSQAATRSRKRSKCSSSLEAWPCECSKHPKILTSLGVPWKAGSRKET